MLPQTWQKESGKKEMDNSYDIKITQIYKVTVGASNEEEAMEIAEHYVSTSPEQYATEKNGIYHLYANLRGINDNKGNFLELLEIVDKKHEDVSTKQLIIEEENE